MRTRSFSISTFDAMPPKTRSSAIGRPPRALRVAARWEANARRSGGERRSDPARSRARRRTIEPCRDTPNDGRSETRWWTREPPRPERHVVHPCLASELDLVEREDCEVSDESGCDATAIVEPEER